MVNTRTGQAEAAPTRHSHPMTPPRYALPVLPGRDLGFVRIGGAGLANLLLPWVRAVIAARRHGLRLIQPTWPQLYELGHATRLLDRLYAGVFRPLPGAVHGARRLALLATAPRLPEAALAAPDRIPPGAIVTFEGMSGETLVGQHRLVREALLASVRPRWLAPLPAEGMRRIGVHVRLGDFHAARSGAAVNARMPLEWYAGVLAQLRGGLGRDVPVDLYTDGSPGEVAPLLEAGARLAGGGPAICDLLALSRCAVVVASRSSFSILASYLGQAPTVWPPMANRGSLFERAGAEAVCDVGDRLPEPFLHEAERCLAAARPAP